MEDGSDPRFTTPARFHRAPECFAVALDGRRSPAHFIARPLQKERGEHPDSKRGLIPRITGESSLDDGLCGNLDKRGGVWFKNGHRKRPHRTREDVFHPKIL